MFGVTVLTDLRRTPLRDQLIRRGCVVSEIHHSAFPGSLSLAGGMTTDIVICFPFPDSQYRDGVLTFSRSRAIQRELRQLPHDVCMGDGRKWRSVPFLPLIDQRDMYSAFVDARIFSGGVYSYLDDTEAYRVIKESVDGYKRKVVNGFDNMGFLVAEKNGRLQLGPALGGKRDLENEYYNSAADKIHKNRSGYVTVDRNLCGIQYEVEQLEFIINSKKTKEVDLQRFFEENPHFIASHRQGTPMPHPKFPLNARESLIPDFLMRPNSALQRDSNWEVLDLKKPNVKLLTGKSNRPAWGHEVSKAIAQLKEYGDYFRNPVNADVIKRILSHHLRFPKLAVLIGRMPKGSGVEQLELAQSREPLVKIITYDEILDFQRNLLD
jgi:hypothetical protein